MMTIFALEGLKLRHSWVVPLVMAPPSLISLFIFICVVRSSQPLDINMWFNSSVSLWAYFMLPMSATALAAVSSHIEHSAGAWDYLRSSPVARWRIYAAKAIWVVGLLWVMGLLNICLTLLAVFLAGLVEPGLKASGQLLLMGHLMEASKVMLASTLLIGIQFWAAIRFSSFVPCLLLGIGGTFFAVAATSAKEGAVVPWQMPINAISQQTSQAETALFLGLGLGLALFAACTIYLSRREVL